MADLDARVTALQSEQDELLELVTQLYAALQAANDQIDRIEKKAPGPELGWHLLVPEEYRDQLRDARITFIDYLNMTKKKARKLGVKDVEGFLKVRWNMREDTIRRAAQRLWDEREEDDDHPPEYYWFSAEKFLGLNPMRPN